MDRWAIHVFEGDVGREREGEIEGKKREEKVVSANSLCLGGKERTYRRIGRMHIPLIDLFEDRI